MLQDADRAARIVRRLLSGPIVKQGARRSSKRRPHDSVRAGPTHVKASLKVAVEHHAAGDLPLAERQYRQILDGDPTNPGALHLLGLLEFQNGNSQTALELIRKAIALSPSEALFQCNLGVVLRRIDRLEESLACAEAAAALDPDDVKPVVERGVVLYGLRRSDEALATFEAVIRRDPENALAHMGIAFIALSRGDFERGWAEFEYRWRLYEAKDQQRGFAQPLWDGRPFDGRTILLHAEQGFGDTLQCVRFAPQVKALGGQVVLESPPELRTLLADAPGVDRVFTRGEPMPSFDIQAPLMSLPWLLGTRLTTVPANVPYLAAAARRARLGSRALLASDRRLKVGLVWAGNSNNQNDHQRTIALQALAPLGRVADIAFFALQKGPGAVQATSPPPGLALVDLGPELRDFADTAAVLSQLDLLITVDTAVAHLAGALGLPVWLLLPFVPDARWMTDRRDSPWYPTARLFRQQRRADWEGVVDEVGTALRVLAQAHTRAASAATANQASRQTHTGVVVALPVNGNIGWAVCGRHIVAELAQLASVSLMSDPFDPASVGDEPTYQTLVALAATDQDPRQAVRLPQPVLQGITSGYDFAPYRPNLHSSSLNVGYTFFEENILRPEAIQNAGRLYDHIVAGSTWCENVLRGYKLESVSTILQGIDPRVFHPSTGAPARQFGDRFVVFSGGKLEFRKGQDLVIRAFKVLQERHPDVLLVNAWFNPWAFSLDTMAASPYIEFDRTTMDHVDFVSQLLVANGVDLTGVVTLPSQSNARMPGMYWDTDVGLFPNRCEGGTNLVLMEYMACGKPVIASYSSGHCDIVTDQNALLIKQLAPLLMNDDDRPIAMWDDPSLEETIERLEWAYQHPAELEPIARQAALDLQSRTWTRTATEFLALLQPNPMASSLESISVEPTLKPADIRKLEDFLSRLSLDVYAEPPTELHSSITTSMVDRLLTSFPQATNARVLDVGCGQGLALAEFAARGLHPIGITLGRDDLAACRRAGFDVHRMDQSFLDFPDADFDVLWCRHCLEHSIHPYFSLSEFERVLKPGGLLYVEVPAPDTSCAHQANPNHYSVLGKSMWLQLMTRSGFAVMEQIDLNFTTPAGPDMYWVFILRKN